MNNSSSYDTIDKQWSAVINRDRNAATAFVFSVTTTGIFCRPNCGARQARKANVNFFTDADAAMQAGYRACKRCRPELESWDPVNDIMEKACDIIRTQAARGTELKLADLAKQCGMTKSHFHRTFKKLKGQTPKEYATTCQGQVHEAPGMHVGQASNFVQILQPAPSKHKLTTDFTLQCQEDLDFGTLLTENDDLLPHTGLLRDDVETDYTKYAPIGSVSHDWSLGLLDDGFTYSDALQNSYANEPNWSRFDHQYPVIQYTITTTHVGKVMIALQHGYVCAIQIGSSDTELLSELYQQFYSMTFEEISLEDAGMDLRTKQNIISVIDALNKPLDRTIDLPFSDTISV